MYSLITYEPLDRYVELDMCVELDDVYMKPLDMYEMLVELDMHSGCPIAFA